MYTIVPATVQGIKNIPVNKIYKQLPLRELTDTYILYNQKFKDRAGLVLLISQVLYFHHHPQQINFPIWLFPSVRRLSDTFPDTSHPEMMTVLEKSGCSFFQNIYINPFPETLQMSLTSHRSALGHMLSPKVLPLLPEGKISLKVCPPQQTACSSMARNIPFIHSYSHSMSIY